MVRAKNGRYCLCPISMLGAFFIYPQLHPLYSNGSNTHFSFSSSCVSVRFIIPSTLLLYLIILFAGDPVTYIPIGWHGLF